MPRGAIAAFPNADGFLATLIAEKAVTFGELKQIDLEDALNLWEIVTINKHNIAAAHAESNK